MHPSFLFSRWLMEFISIVKVGDSEWQKEKLKEIAEIKRQKAITDIELDREIKLLKIKYAEQVNRAQERESRITQDYQEFLDKIDEMKSQIVETFPDMPKALALVIHQHAKQLIDDMWNKSDDKTQGVCRAKLAEFLKVVCDDTTQVLFDEDKSMIPKRTLELIQKD